MEYFEAQHNRCTRIVSLLILAIVLLGCDGSEKRTAGTSAADQADVLLGRADPETAERVISDQIVEILLPILAVRLTEEGIKQFAGEVKAMFESAQPVSIELGGPDELVARLMSCLETEHDWKVGGKGPDIRRVTGSETELRVVHGCSMIETRLGEWLATIHKAAP